jgi:beta-galactosidase
MIEIRNRQLLIDGVPRVVMCGEIHYFRVPREQWGDRIASLKAAGCTAVAAYIPWLIHELPDGSIDVTGETLPERDVAGFIDLCRDAGLWFVARPGPFIMAELKNEGLPYSVYTDHPEIIPTGWDQRPTTTATVDYLAPGFLTECKRWYDAVLPAIAERLQPRGGNVIAVQLDNEIGMLAWVTNTPELTTHLLADLLLWVREQHGDATASRYPVDLDDPDAWAKAVRSPQEAWAPALRLDLGNFMRHRFKRYVEALRGFAESAGIRDVPFIINIHGTAGGDGAPFPIGISQLVDTYAGVPGMLSGSDHYLGDITLDTATDLYVMNAFMAAVHDVDQPLTSVEFEAGTGDYGGGHEKLYEPSTIDLKTRICVAQGNRLINYYLFAGGINRHLDSPAGDGNDRISILGEEHGMAAPVGPNGQHGLTYGPTAAAVAAINTQEPWLARMSEEHDDLALGFVLDSYMTEYSYPDSAAMAAIVTDLETHRGAGQRKALARSFLLGGYRFGAVDLQVDRHNGDVDHGPKVIALATGRHLARAVQQRLVEHLDGAGGLLLLGKLPELDLEGQPCRVLADALAVTAGAVVTEGVDFYPTVASRPWLEAIPDKRAGWLQPLDAEGAQPLLVDVSTGLPCGLEIRRGAGRAVLLTAELASHPGLFTSIARRLGAEPGLVVQADNPGLLATTTATPDGERLVHVINVIGYDTSVRLTLNGQDLHDGKALIVPGHSGHMLPLGLRLPTSAAVTVAWASAEITSVTSDEVAFGVGLGGIDGGPGTVVVLESDATITAGTGHQVQRAGQRWTVSAPPGSGPVRIGIAPA